MSGTKYIGILILLAFVERADAHDSGFRFLATGDMPYSADQEVRYRRLLGQSAGEDFAFLMHVGDIKAGGAPCSDVAFEKIRDLFREYPKPVVYTPGDNEWTDCHNVGADPIERLDKLRALFFKDREALRLEELNVVRQSRRREFATYVENYRFSKSGVLFIIVHIVGSGNNRRADDPPSMIEFGNRNAANAAFLKESFAEAIAGDVLGVVVAIHANPGFEEGTAASYRDFFAAMRSFLSKYSKPVVCIHGDSHYYRIDKPFKDESGRTYLHFTRMEVFGSPNVAGVVVAINPTDPQVFGFRPYYLQGK